MQQINGILKNDELKMALESRIENIEISCSACGKIFEFVDFSTDKKPECDKSNSFVTELNQIGFNDRVCECGSQAFNMKSYTSLIMYSLGEQTQEVKNV